MKSSLSRDNPPAHPIKHGAHSADVLPGMADHRRSLLVVEDDEVIRETLADLLSEDGTHVTCAFDGAAALALLAQAGRKPDGIVLDVMMPVMDGYEFRARQLADPELRDIPVLVMTAHAERDVVASRLGARVIRKPFDLDELQRRVVELYQPRQTD